MATQMGNPSFRRQQLDGIYLPHVEPINRLVEEDHHSRRKGACLWTGRAAALTLSTNYRSRFGTCDRRGLTLTGDSGMR